ncbi:MAG: RtcB family protein [Gammaproteobacteria bacterium]|nr:MAG: RtcB family protein [Gammaproteobacteria bacterium]UCH39780.1 MAG: RtcB family protein [Gammaproteobacteria bacterium]
MKIDLFKQRDDTTWEIPASGQMRVPAIIYADRALIEAMDERVYQQITNVATLPGIVDFAYAMPDAHWGYGFPIGGVAAFDADEGGVISAGGVGFDISCGVRTLHTGLAADEVALAKEALADELYRRVPTGLGSTGSIHLGPREMDAMLGGGALWAVKQGYGLAEDLERTEEQGCMRGADPSQVSERARHRQRNEMGTLGSGNHYLEVQYVDRIYDERIAKFFKLRQGDVVVSIHCGSRGLGHQIGTEFLRLMATSASQHGIYLPDRELACAPIKSDIGQSYLGAMRAGINCALANRQIITHLTRQAFEAIIPGTQLHLLYDVSHNTCKLEPHSLEGRKRNLYVHRKGATRAFGPGHPELPSALREAGQPVLIGGSMGTCSYILAGTSESEQRAFSSACHGAGRAMSRRRAKRLWRGRQVIDELRQQGIIIRSPSLRGVAEEAPLAYKDVASVVDAADQAGLARKVARLRPLVCVKG